MAGCMILKGEERGNAARETKLEFSQTICNGVVIKDGLAQHPDPESTVRLDFVTSPIGVDDVANMDVLDAIDSALRTAEIVLSHGLTAKQSKLAWDFLLWLSTFIKPVRNYKQTGDHDVWVSRTSCSPVCTDLHLGAGANEGARSTSVRVEEPTAFTHTLWWENGVKRVPTQSRTHACRMCVHACAHAPLHTGPETQGKVGRQWGNRKAGGEMEHSH